MQPASPETLVIAGDTRELRVLIGDQDYRVRPMRVPQIERFLREGGADLTTTLSSAFAGESAAGVAWPELIVTHGARLRLAVHIATGIPQAVIDDLDPAGLIRVTEGVLQVNLDFFVQRVRPALGSLVMRMMQIAQRASPRSSPTASPH